MLYPVCELVQMPLEISKNIGASMPFFRNLKEKHSGRRRALLNDMDRFFQVFNNLTDRCNGITDVKGKTVLEIGPGNSLAIALLFLASGAKKVFLVDRYKHLFWDEADSEFHMQLMKRIEHFPFASEAFQSINIDTSKGVIEFDHERIQYQIGDVSYLPLENETIDIVFSNAVLEHVHEISKAIGELSRVTKSGGYGIHEIDLRDHFHIHANPLRLLGYPDGLWNAMTYYRPGYTNRLRLSDYTHIFEESGFLTIKVIVTRRYEGDLSKIKMAKKFLDYTSDDIKTLAFWTLLQKNTDPAHGQQHG